jgi:hypothetical protein
VRSVGSSMPAGSNSDARLPDGTTATTQAAGAARTAQSGASVAAAGPPAGMPLPPLGALGLKPDRAGGSADQRRPDAKRRSDDDDEDSDHNRRR